METPHIKISLSVCACVCRKPDEAHEVEGSYEKVSGVGRLHVLR